MPAFRYTGESDRYYPSLSLAPEPGEEYELDAAPDARFEAVEPVSPSEPDPEPEAEPEPVAEYDPMADPSAHENKE